MPRQSVLRTIKRWKQYQPLAEWNRVIPSTRGLYVLYRKREADKYEVVYIGVAGLGNITRGGIKRRLRTHVARKPGWTHFSYFEVHDNVTSEEIRELESLLLVIFRHDERIALSNKQTGSRKLFELRKPHNWKASEA